MRKTHFRGILKLEGFLEFDGHSKCPPFIASFSLFYSWILISFCFGAGQDSWRHFQDVCCVSARRWQRTSSDLIYALKVLKPKHKGKWQAGQSPNKWQQFRWQSATAIPPPSSSVPRKERIRIPIPIPIPITFAENPISKQIEKKQQGKVQVIYLNVSHFLSGLHIFLIYGKWFYFFSVHV